MNNTGLFKGEQRAQSEKELEKELSQYHGPDMLVLKILIDGKVNGVYKEVNYEMIDLQDVKAPGHTAMQRTTGYSASIVAQMISAERIKAKGAVYQELSVPTNEFVRQWLERGLNLKKNGVIMHPSLK
jgi:saccharopine dehydrogenase-like NADP-dependent oxidoreductase